MPDHGGKTEDPTQRRLEKARKDGQFPQAKEFVGALQFMVFLTLLGASGAEWMATLGQTTRSLFALAFSGELSIQILTSVAWAVSRRLILPLAVAGAGSGGSFFCSCSSRDGRACLAG